MRIFFYVEVSVDLYEFGKFCPKPDSQISNMGKIKCNILKLEVFLERYFDIDISNINRPGYFLND